MDIDYSLEALEKTFKEHSKESKKNLEIQRQKHKEYFPNEEFKYDEFCLPDALLSIVLELIALRAKK